MQYQLGKKWLPKDGLPVRAIRRRRLWLDVGHNSPSNNGIDTIGSNQKIKGICLPAFSSHIDLFAFLVVQLGDFGSYDYVCSALLCDIYQPFVQMRSVNHPPRLAQRVLYPFHWCISNLCAVSFSHIELFHSYQIVPNCIGNAPGSK